MAADKYQQVKMGRKDIFFNNLIGGVAWALGATVGLTLILAVVGFILSKLDTAPLVGEYVKAVTVYIDRTQRH